MRFCVYVCCAGVVLCVCVVVVRVSVCTYLCVLLMSGRTQCGVVSGKWRQSAILRIGWFPRWTVLESLPTYFVYIFFSLSLYLS